MKPFKELFEQERHEEIEALQNRIQKLQAYTFQESDVFYRAEDYDSYSGDHDSWNRTTYAEAATALCQHQGNHLGAYIDVMGKEFHLWSYNTEEILKQYRATEHQREAATKEAAEKKLYEQLKQKYDERRS